MTSSANRSRLHVTISDRPRRGVVRATDYRVALAALAAEGTAPLGPGRLHGRSGIRACVTNYRNTPADKMWETAIRRLGADPAALQMSRGVH